MIANVSVVPTRNPVIAAVLLEDEDDFDMFNELCEENERWPKRHWWELGGTTDAVILGHGHQSP